MVTDWVHDIHEETKVSFWYGWYHEEVLTGLVGSSILSIVAIDSTHIRITFQQPVLNNIALNTPSLYVIEETPGDPIVTVLDIVVENPTQILLTTTEMRQGASYSIEIEHVEPA